MTRINLVPPAELMDQHLFAEFREIKMIPKSLRRSLTAVKNAYVKRRELGYANRFRVQLVAERTVLAKVPPEYVLGTGHVSFFYDKGMYLQVRYAQLKNELCVRGVNFDREALFDSDHIFGKLPDVFNKWYNPTPEALALVRQRIKERIALRPGWYRYYGKPI